MSNMMAHMVSMLGLTGKDGEMARLLMSQSKLRKILFYFFLDKALRKKDISLWQTADCGLSTKGWPHAHIFTNHIKWHNGTPTHLHTRTNIPYKSNQKQGTHGGRAIYQLARPSTQKRI